MFSTTLINEYLLLLKQGFTCEELYNLNLKALEVSFADSETKNQVRLLLKQYEESRISFQLASL